MLSYDDLAEFIERRMTMSHVYQPLVVRELIEAGGTATLRQLALALVREDEPTVQQAEDRLRNFPVKTLRKHEVIEYDAKRRVLSLQIQPLTFEQRAHLRMLCEQRLQQYRQQRGLSIWGDLPATPAGRTLRYDVLAESGGRCALCGATAKDRQLDVDHIIPMSKGGKTEKSNLQVLCSACNRAKRNRDDRDFRSDPIEKQEGCAFCEMPEHRVIRQQGTVFAVRDAHPVSPLHTLVIARRHCEDFLNMTEQERADAHDLARVLAKEIQAEDLKVSGYNIGANCGATAGQTVMHAHLHLIPRRKGDVNDPRGGVRGAIPSKMAY
jgi:ATP adenylyltransferase